MTRNMGVADRAIRVVLALLAAWLFFSGRVGGVPGIVVVVIGAVLLLSSLAGYCPLYVPLHISTLGKPSGGTPPAGAPH